VTTNCEAPHRHAQATDGPSLTRDDLCAEAIRLARLVVDLLDETDWAQIVALYDVLRRVAPSPVVALNRAAALGMRDGPEAGLATVEAVLGQGDLDGYHLAHAARADMQRRLGLAEAARASYQRALDLTRQPAERRFLQARLAQLAAGRTTVRD
jgi:RNA polymerase sigma-70 factor (ECF subfamily)